jgi:hypothetical protein
LARAAGSSSPCQPRLPRPGRICDGSEGGHDPLP